MEPASDGRFLPTGLVTLTSDFGQVDGYVGAMKGVMLSVSRDLQLVDIAHDLPPQQVPHAAGTVAASAPWFPAGTVHLVVVDPGVGSDRAALAVRAGTHCFVGPDNGVLVEAATRAAGGGDVVWRRISSHPWVLPERSATFHGRDVFAPTAAALASGGLAFEDVGPVCEPRRLLVAEVQQTERGLVGEVVRVDRFGNLVTNVEGSALPGSEARCAIAGIEGLPIRTTYSDVDPGALVALVGSDGFLEVAVRDGSALERLGVRVGEAVCVHLRGAGWDGSIMTRHGGE